MCEDKWAHVHFSFFLSTEYTTQEMNIKDSNEQEQHDANKGK
jgi:hypothetical protein